MPSGHPVVTRRVSRDQGPHLWNWAKKVKAHTTTYKPMGSMKWFNRTAHLSPVTVREGQGPLTDLGPVDSERTAHSYCVVIIDRTSVTSSPQEISAVPEDQITDQSVTCDSRPVTDTDPAAEVPVHVRHCHWLQDTDSQHTTHSGYIFLTQATDHLTHTFWPFQCTNTGQVKVRSPR